jgi:hypothetical protein
MPRTKATARKSPTTWLGLSLNKYETKRADKKQFGPTTREDYLKENMVKEFKKAYDDARKMHKNGSNIFVSDSDESNFTKYIPTRKADACNNLVSLLTTVGAVSDDTLRDKVNELRREMAENSAAEWDAAHLLNYDAGTALGSGNHLQFSELAQFLKLRFDSTARRAAPLSWFQ